MSAGEVEVDDWVDSSKKNKHRTTFVTNLPNSDILTSKNNNR